MSYLNQIKALALKAIYAAGSGHPGGSLSVAEILDVLYFEIMSPQPYRWTDGRDICILSKGHACPALYACFVLLGALSEAQLMDLRKLGSPTQGHPAYTWLKEVETSTGSLGQGFGVAVGMALGLKLKQSARRVFCVVGEGDLHEGISAEAARLASYHKLNNLTVIADYNKKQSDQFSALMINPQAEFEAYGWHVYATHTTKGLRYALNNMGERPHFILHFTAKGSGVDFMEQDKSGYHGSVELSAAQLEKALEQLQ